MNAGMFVLRPASWLGLVECSGRAELSVDLQVGRLPELQIR